MISPEPYKHRPYPAGPALSRRTILGGVVLGLGGLLSACGSGEASIIPTPGGPPVKGGSLRVGLAGGGASDTLDAHSPVNNPDIARVMNLYEALLYRDADFALQPLLALSATADDAALVWTVKLRPGVRFHDGRAMTSKDVVASFARVMNPKDPKSQAAALAILDDVVAMNDLEVEFRLNTPTATFDDSLGQYALGIVPADYDPAHPVGTGPFKAKSFDAGRQSVFTRNDYYWRENEPHLDELVILNFSDDDALINALLSTQVDAIGQIPLALLEVIGADPRIDILNSTTGAWLPFTMRVDKEPFDDVRVRQAFRLAVDRPQMIEQVLSGNGTVGNGTVGNDLFAPFDPGYAKNLPQRTQDIPQARELLAEAGYPDGIDIELVTAPIQSGAVEAAQVFAQQAAAAGIRVKIRRVDTTTFFGDDYLSWTFSQDFWYTRNFLPQVSSSMTSTSPFNETHMDDPEFLALAEQAATELDEATRNSLITQAQEILYERGGYIIWGFPNQADAYQRYVAGLTPNKTGMSLSGYEFRRVWIGDSK